MKKKIALIFSLIVTIFLTACAGSNSREKEIVNNYRVEPVMSDTLKEKYKLDFANTSVLSTLAVSLGNNSAANANDYYTVYCSKNTENSLIKVTYNSDEELSKHIYEGTRNKNKTFVANALYFDLLLKEAEGICYDQVQDENKRPTELEYYKQTLIDIVMNAKVLNVVYEKDSMLNNMSFANYKFTQDTSASFAKTCNSQYAGDALIDGKKNIKFEIVYLPLYVVRTINTNIVASAILLPIYTTFTVDNKEIKSENNKYTLVDSTIATMPEVSVIFDSETGAILS